MTNEFPDFPNIPPGVHHITKQKEMEDAAKTILARHLFYDHDDSLADIEHKLQISSHELKSMLGTL